MKTYLKLLFLVACIVSFAGCENDENLFFNEDSAELKAAKIKVRPCSSSDVLFKAETDHKNIEQALRNAKPGEVVQLAQGTFYLDSSVICTDFSGTLKGAGMGKTIIRTAPGFTFDGSRCPPRKWTFETGDRAIMLYFKHTKTPGERTVTVSDMTIIGDEPSNKDKNSIHAVIVGNSSLDSFLHDPIQLNVNYKNLRIIGEKDPKYEGGYSLFTAVGAYGASNGYFQAKNVQASEVGVAFRAYAFTGDDAVVTVKNCEVQTGRFGVHSFINHSWNIVNNQFYNCEKGVTMMKLGPQSDWVGIDGKSFVKNNRIHFTNVGVAAMDLSNLQVKDNVLEGSGRFGGIAGMISMFGRIAGLKCNNWIIKDNDLCGVTPVAPNNCTMFLAITNSEVKDNANQIIAGPGITEDSNIIGKGRGCNDDD